ncbi:hypothetical protein [Mycobacterium sp. AZCC_0083]|uniref:hypothetical protein n=1 Tax=Mycobacterium sp. AZCC_0083 TaxID=2735882 RepID=UPI00160EAE24|nr:hypothetical protein [Mycobacterium sp. AZCC_0083]MBB5163554.1 hypothetical protein [Mycobacterium sp. AZCC_0083]
MRTRLLIVGVTAVVLVVAGIVMALVDRPHGDDCRQAERALQPWGATMPDVYQNLPPDIASPPTGDDEQPDYAAAAAREAQAANDIRTAADLVGSATLRANLYTVADAFDELSRSRLTPSSPSAPSTDFFRATTRMTAAIHDIKQACPTIGEGTPVTP